MNQALSNLQNSLGYDQSVQDRGSEIAYALYVLARNKKASIGDLRYYADTQLEAFRARWRVAQLAASLALYGDTQRSEATFQTALQLAKSQPPSTTTTAPTTARRCVTARRCWRWPRNSKPVPTIVPELIKLVARERAEVRWTSTQDDSWMLLAARALKEGNDSITLTVNGAPHSGGYSNQDHRRRTGRQPARHRQHRQDPAAGGRHHRGVADPAPAGRRRRLHHRRAPTTSSTATRPMSREATQNERYVVVLKVNEQNSWPSRLLITDLLPAGFEIDNPGLVSSAQLTNFSWLAQTDAAHLEFRDDRFVAAFNPTTATTTATSRSPMSCAR